MSYSCQNIYQQIFRKSGYIWKDWSRSKHHQSLKQCHLGVRYKFFSAILKETPSCSHLSPRTDHFSSHIWEQPISTPWMLEAASAAFQSLGRGTRAASRSCSNNSFPVNILGILSLFWAIFKGRGGFIVRRKKKKNKPRYDDNMLIPKPVNLNGKCGKDGNEVDGIEVISSNCFLIKDTKL